MRLDMHRSIKAMSPGFSIGVSIGCCIAGFAFNDVAYFITPVAYVLTLIAYAIGTVGNEEQEES